MVAGSVIQSRDSTWDAKTLILREIPIRSHLVVYTTVEIEASVPQC